MTLTKEEESLFVNYPAAKATGFSWAETIKPLQNNIII